MTDPVTILTVSAIADLAFQEFIKSEAGEVAKKFTAEARVFGVPNRCTSITVI